MVLPLYVCWSTVIWEFATSAASREYTAELALPHLCGLCEEATHEVLWRFPVTTATSEC